MTINEPQVFIGCGYAIGKFAPFEVHQAHDLTRMTHNVLLAHGKAVQAKRKSFAFTKNRFPFELAWWADPIFFGKYPEEAYRILGNDMPEILEGDMEIISQPVDFYGVNIYESKATETEFGYAENAYIGCARTQMGWPVTPEVRCSYMNAIRHRFCLVKTVWQAMTGYSWTVKFMIRSELIS